jgi:hypothetical protein
MGTDLLDELVKKPQRETAGLETNLRYEYQRNWAFCEMLRRHMSKADYLVAFEFHDDVLFLDPSRTPQVADFYQVKTTSSAQPRKRSTLTARLRRGNSILGKMCLNFTGICASHDVRVVLVSNVAFEFSGRDICATDIDDKHRNIIIEKLKAELPSFVTAQLERIHFVVTGVSIEAIQSYLQGETMNLFETQFGENHGLNIMSWIRLVQGEISRKNNHASEKVTTVDELVERKCIGRAFIDQSLACVSRKRRLNPDMTLVNGALAAAGWSTPDLIRLSKRLPQVVSDYTDGTNVEVAEMARVAEEAIASEAMQGIDIPECIQQLQPMIKVPTGNIDVYDRMYISALVILVYYEAI